MNNANKRQKHSVEFKKKKAESIRLIRKKENVKLKSI